MIRTGRVVHAENHEIQVCFQRPEMCAHCGACGEKQEALVTLSFDAREGDMVDVEYPQQNLLRTSFFVYAVPLLFLLAGIFSGVYFLRSEIFGAVLGLCMLLFSFLLIKLYDRHLKNKPCMMPKVIAVHPSQAPSMPDR